MFRVTTALLAAILLAGCLGVSDIIGPYVGSWSGTYRINEPNGTSESVGLISFSIDQAGTVSGVLDRTDLDQTPVPLLGGRIDAFQELKFNFRYPDTGKRDVRGQIAVDFRVLEPLGTPLVVTFPGGLTGTMQISLVKTR